MATTVHCITPLDDSLAFSIEWIADMRRFGLCKGCNGLGKGDTRQIDVVLDAPAEGPAYTLAPHVGGLLVASSVLDLVRRSLAGATIGRCYVKERADERRGKNDTSKRPGDRYRVDASYATVVMPAGRCICLRGGTRSKYFICKVCNEQYASFLEPPVHAVATQVRGRAAWVSHDYELCVNHRIAKAIGGKWKKHCTLDPIPVLPAPLDGKRLREDGASVKKRSQAAYAIIQWNPDGDLEFSDEIPDPRWVRAQKPRVICTGCGAIRRGCRASPIDVVVKAPMKWAGEAIAHLRGVGIALCRDDIAAFLSKRDSALHVGRVLTASGKVVTGLRTVVVEKPVAVRWSSGTPEKCDTCGSLISRMTTGLGVASRSSVRDRDVFGDWLGHLYVCGRMLEEMDRANLDQWSYQGITIR